MQVFDGESYKEVLGFPWVSLFWHKQMALAGDVSFFNLFLFLVLLLVGAWTQWVAASQLLVYANPWLQEPLSWISWAKNLSWGDLLARVHWILRPVKAFKSYWFSVWLVTSGDKTWQYLWHLDIADPDGRCKCLWKRDSQQRRRIAFWDRGLSWLFWPQTFTLQVKVDGANSQEVT